MKKLVLSPLFVAGLLLKFVLIYFVQPQAAMEWYGPFLEVSVSRLSLDPWGVWLAQGGNPVAFPYGSVMWLIFLPGALISKVTGLGSVLCYSLTLLAADFGLLVSLRRLFPGRERLLLGVYWLSPIVLWATYGLGLNDLIPVLLLTCALLWIRHLRLFGAGLFLMASISAKLSMIVAFPFFLIYLYQNRALRQLFKDFAKGVGLGLVLFILPFLASASGLTMLLSNPEMNKIYQFAMRIGDHTDLYIAPLVYLVVLYAAWRIRRMNFDLFNSVMGLAFLVVVLLTPASPGWFIWTMPLLVSYQMMSGRIAIALNGLFAGLYVMSFMVASSALKSSLNLSEQWSLHFSSVLHTVIVAVGVVLAIRVWREAVSRNDFFRLSRKPFVIGIAGDSGAGKDTFADSLTGLFGAHSVAGLSGDDYHLWDRHKPMWRVMTHLNPMANDLERFANDVVSLSDSRTIYARHYDHQTGKMTRPFHVRSNDFVLVSGLHALYLPILRSCYDLSIYLDIDERLRRHFKIRRDVHQRGHSLEKVLASFERREPDSARFIRSQAAHADLLLSLQPLQPLTQEDAPMTDPIRFKLHVTSRNGLNELSLIRVLVGICGLRVDMSSEAAAAPIEMTIEGDISADDIAMASRILCPRLLEFLDVQPVWHDGMLGLMQLITLTHINQALTKRFV